MKAKHVLNIRDFDPFEVDISFIKKVSQEIPQEGFTDAGMAERLATATLKAAELCDDLLGQAVLYLSDCEAEKKAARSRAIAGLLEQKKPSTVVDKLCSSDPEFIRATEKYNKALALHTWLGNKHSTLIKTHHWCKDFVRRTEATMGAAGWLSSGDSTDESSFATSSPRSPSTSSREPSTEKRTSGKSSWSVD